MTSISAVPGSALLAPTIDTSKGKPTVDQVRQELQNNANHNSQFPNISPDEVQRLNSEQMDRLNKYPTLTYQDVLNGHGVKGGDNFVW
ncbi:hypothetical protein J2Y83_002358 [Pseudomonas marginalis]|uniref:hypothetical protein n=1 Tax=Pseudomonas TaxID=286 RepID=UPI00209FC1B0|nr:MULTISPECIES: hypothetical protein [Pseudomonas]MCP1506385.1 hypothetical protein [Pseudomonas marginalis]MCP1523889.1 hypothetical protein [Pseudomonas marginalis]MDQ0502295.1 hypothetical protein [Pseudomonas marginalis]